MAVRLIAMEPLALTYAFQKALTSHHIAAFHLSNIPSGPRHDAAYTPPVFMSLLLRIYEGEAG